MVKYAGAFKKIKRVDFLPDKMRNLASLDTALGIGYGQTISQPSVVVFMIMKLEPQPGDKVLDIGSGSGWTTALLAEIVGSKGKVIALEIVPELKEFGEKNAQKYGFVKEGRAEFVLADGSKGFPNMASRPELVEGFDRILCSAAVEKEIPKSWKEQLKVGGKIVAPVGSSIWVFTKKSENRFKEEEYPGFAFVPLLQNK